MKFRSGNNCFAKFMPLSEELQNYQTFQLADTPQRKRCQPSVLTNCPDRKEGPFQGVNAGTIRVSSNITIRGLVTTMVTEDLFVWGCAVPLKRVKSPTHPSYQISIWTWNRYEYMNRYVSITSISNGINNISSFHCWDSSFMFPSHCSFWTRYK